MVFEFGASIPCARLEKGKNYPVDVSVTPKRTVVEENDLLRTNVRVHFRGARMEETCGVVEVEIGFLAEDDFFVMF